MDDLNEVFKSVDIDGEGKLDQGSFLTALVSLGVQLPENDLTKIFEELDEDDTGYIEYDRVTEFLKLGKIPSSLLNKVKKSKAPRKSVIIGQAKNGGKGGAAPLDAKGGKGTSLLTTYSSGRSLLVPDTSSKGHIKSGAVKMDPARNQMIKRAVIVIKKAMMKNITRNEVFEFLQTKGMTNEDIEISYLRAQEDVMNPEERLKYLQDLAESRLGEVTEYQKVNKYLTNEITSHTREIEILKSLLNTATNVLFDTFPNTYKDIPPKGVRDEIKYRLKKTKADHSSAEEMKDDRAMRVHQKDIDTLVAMDKCVNEKKHFHAFLSFFQLDEVIRDAMPVVQQFLSNYDNPKTKPRDAPDSPQSG